MKMKTQFDVAQTPEVVWEFLNDIPRVASCLPGADISTKVDDDHYTGTVVIKAGPAKLDFDGEATVTERDEQARRIVVDASGADVKGRGQAALLVSATVEPAGAGSRVNIDQELHLAGSAAQYGRGLVQDITAILLDDFASNMNAQLEALATGTTAELASSSSASGFGIALRAGWLGVVRILRRFFVPYKPSSG